MKPYVNRSFEFKCLQLRAQVLGRELTDPSRNDPDLLSS